MAAAPSPLSQSPAQAKPAAQEVEAPGEALGLQNHSFYLVKTRFLKKFQFSDFLNLGGVPGPMLGRFWLHFGVLGSPGETFGGHVGDFGVPWAPLGLLGALLGSLGAALGIPLGPSWPILGSKGLIWEPFWLALGSILLVLACFRLDFACFWIGLGLIR